MYAASSEMEMDIVKGIVGYCSEMFWAFDMRENRMELEILVSLSGSMSI